MAYLNQAQIIGNLGKDPEARNLSSDQIVSNFSVATTKKWTKDNEQKELTTWHNISAFGKLADLCQMYLRKGSQVYISGEIRQDQWEDDQGNKKYKTYIVAQEVQFLSKNENKTEVEPKKETAQEAPKSQPKSLAQEKNVKNYAPGAEEPPKIDDEEILPF